MEDEIVNELAREVGCGTRKLPFIYLGLPVRGNPRLKFFVSLVVEKIERRLVGWGRKYLSMGGRLTLVNNLLVFP